MIATLVPVSPVLVLDRDANLQGQTVRWLQAAGHHVLIAASADQALEALARAPVAVALCEVSPPGPRGLQVFELLRERSPETALIMATVAADVGPAVLGLRLGVIDCLIKPFGRDRLREAVRRGVDWHKTAVSVRVLHAQVEQELAQRQRQLEASLRELSIDSDAALDALVGMLTISVPGLHEHGRRVAATCRRVAHRLGLSAEDSESLFRAALVHDLPRLAIPDAIARKAGLLLPLERALIHRLPVIGRDLCRGQRFLTHAAPIVSARYEWWDGSGYPEGLRGQTIPLTSRILAVADTFDTLHQPRTYRPAMDEAEAVAELFRGAGTQFDPDIVRAFRQAQTESDLPMSAA